MHEHALFRRHPLEAGAADELAPLIDRTLAEEEPLEPHRKPSPT